MAGQALIPEVHITNALAGNTVARIAFDANAAVSIAELRLAVAVQCGWESMDVVLVDTGGSVVNDTDVLDSERHACLAAAHMPAAQPLAGIPFPF